MISEVNSTSITPYSSVVLVKAFYSNGFVSIGTGVLVGKNDVLTAGHVIYNPTRGGYANSIQITPGADYNGVTGVMERAPFGTLSHGSIKAWPPQIYADADNSTTNFSEIPWDLALIGLSRPIGLEVGWFGLAQGRNFNQAAKEIGYPATGTGMMQGNSYAYSSNALLISATTLDRSALLGVGSSGGPLFIDSTPAPKVLGIKSSGNASVNYWADIDFLYDEILLAINQNDDLIGSSHFLVGTKFNDQFIDTTSSDVINGVEGIDSIQYQGLRSNYSVFNTGNNQTVVTSKGQSQIGDALTNVERLVFSDSKVATDTAINQAAGQAVLLLGTVLPGQLVFDTSKQKLIGNIIDLFDQGYNLDQLAGAVLRLPIWNDLTQKINPTTDDITTYLMKNINPNINSIELASGIRQMQAENTQSQGNFLASLIISENAQTHVNLIGIWQAGLQFT